MKKLIYIFTILMMVCSCASKEDKANKLIDQYMYKHLHDYKSYEPIETKLDTLFNSPITDEECIEIVKSMSKHLDKKKEYDDEADHDDRTMDIWSGGWSATSRSEYQKAYKSWCEHKRSSIKENIYVLEDVKKLLKRMEVLDGKTQIGWIASHSFRSNTLGGNSSLGNYTFFVDKDIKEILFTMSEDDAEVFEGMPEALLMAQSFETVEKTDSLITRWNEVIVKYDDMIEKANR